METSCDQVDLPGSNRNKNHIKIIQQEKEAFSATARADGLTQQDE